MKDFNSHFNINFVCFFVVDICINVFFIFSVDGDALYSELKEKADT